MCQVLLTDHHTHGHIFSFQLSMEFLTPSVNFIPLKQKLLRKAMRLCTPLLRNAAVVVHLFTMFPARAIVTAIMLYFLIYGSLLAQLLVTSYVIHIILDRNTPHQGGRSANATGQPNLNIKIHNTDITRTDSNKYQEVLVNQHLQWNKHIDGLMQQHRMCHLFLKCDWFRESSYFQYMAEFFPLNLVQTAELPSDRNYLVVSHPHCVWFMAYSLAFAADVFRLQARKGLRTFVTTINTNFVLPFAREYLLAAGFVSVSEKSLKHLLEEPKGGNFVSVLPGGSAEAALAEPGQYHIILNSRKGFCRVAIQTGANLVPTFAFGEVECYSITHAAEDSLVAKCQQFVKKWTGINPVFYRNPDSRFYFLSMPKRSTITIVMGAPIEVEKKSNPSLEEINELHRKYVETVRSLFEKEKHKYLNNASNIKLIID